MYNENIKSAFINDLPTDALKLIYKSLFSRTENYETQLGKDIAEFNLQECLGLLDKLKPKSIISTGVFKSQFGKYTKWAKENCTPADKNYWVLVPVDDDFVRQSFEKRYVKDLDELTHIVNMSLDINYDKYVIYLLYMGIMGENCIEVCGLLRTDVKEKQRMINTERWIYTSIPDPLYELITSKADLGLEFKSRNEDSPYFIKPFLTKKLLGNSINKSHIYSVFKKMNNRYSELTKEERDFTPTTIWRSGLFYSLYKIELTKDDLTNDDYKEVMEIYGLGVGSLPAVVKEYNLYRDVFWGG